MAQNGAKAIQAAVGLVTCAQDEAVTSVIFGALQAEAIRAGAVDQSSASMDIYAPCRKKRCPRICRTLPAGVADAPGRPQPNPSQSKTDNR